ncbi:restriction endonuclease subunit S [Flavobacterium sp. XS1P27]|uniref:restriction endonuclease subunit S n=1 Tax=Flavobacterium sp. XS1P27 TaxID=3401724 RepID=UPI003AACE703
MNTATLQIEKKKILVPQLRFQEFKDEWEKKTLSELAKKITDGTHDTPKPTKEGVPFLTAIHIKDGFVDYNNCYYLDQEVHNSIYKRCNPEKDDLLIVNIGAGTATCAINSVDYEFSLKNVALVKPKKEILNGKFLAQIQRKKSSKIFNQLTSGGAQPFLSLKEIGRLNISFPTLPEQQKIASFLSVVDEKIQQLSRKKELLEQYKKGVMQQLFLGKLRFKDENGKDYPDWEEKTFGDIFSFYTTNSLSREKLNYENGTVRNIHYGDIHTKFKTLFNLKNELVPFINSDFDVSKIKSECYCQEGDLVIADASEDYADIGKSIEIINLQNEKVIAGLHTFLARPNKTKMFIGFSGYILRSTNFRKQIMTIAQGSKVLSISTGRIAMIKMKIPKVEEQQKIANFLSNIDSKIESTNQQINQTQSFKKGLLQQMFV